MPTHTIELKVDAAMMADILSPTIANALAVMLAQREKGIAKYGKSLEDANLSPAELLNHAREEAADLSVYLSALDKALKERYKKLSAIFDMLLIDIHAYIDRRRAVEGNSSLDQYTVIDMLIRQARAKANELG